VPLGIVYKSGAKGPGNPFFAKVLSVLNVLEFRPEVLGVDLPYRILARASVYLGRPAVLSQVGWVIRRCRHPLAGIHAVLWGCRRHIIMGQPVKRANPKLPGRPADLRQPVGVRSHCPVNLHPRLLIPARPHRAGLHDIAVRPSRSRLSSFRFSPV
jgi:hypothetical protein